MEGSTELKEIEKVLGNMLLTLQNLVEQGELVVEQLDRLEERVENLNLIENSGFGVQDEP